MGFPSTLVTMVGLMGSSENHDLAALSPGQIHCEMLLASALIGQAVRVRRDGAER